MKDYRNYLVGALYIIALTAVLMNASCASKCKQQKRYWSTHRAVQIMRTEQMEQRLLDIKNEVYSLDSLRECNDDVNIHIIEEQIDSLLTERQLLTDLLESCFDQMIGL